MFGQTPAIIQKSMSLFGRLFSSDYRIAKSSEASGDMETAARYYVLAKSLEDASRCYIALASRAETRELEIEALYNAYHFAPSDQFKIAAAGKLGRALLAKCKAESIATQEDNKTIEDAANKLSEGLLHDEAAEAWLLIDNTDQAAKAYKQGGNVKRMEGLLKAQSNAEEKERHLHSLEEEFNSLYKIGLRSKALGQLKRAQANAPSDSLLARKISDLESKFITRGRWKIQRDSGPRVQFLVSQEHTLGRDPSCDIQLSTVGVSRQHAKIKMEQNAFVLYDHLSKNGVWLNGVRINESAPLENEGHIRLGDHCNIFFRQENSCLYMTPSTKDKHLAHYVLSKSNDSSVSTFDENQWQFRVEEGTPFLIVDNQEVHLNGQIVANGEIELIIDDNLQIGQKVYTVSI